MDFSVPVVYCQHFNIILVRYVIKSHIKQNDSEILLISKVILGYDVIRRQL